jgi:integrase
VRRLFAVALYLGVRDSELAGLPWDAIDFEHGVIHIRQQWPRDSETVVPYAKSDRGNRHFAIERSCARC